MLFFQNIINIQNNYEGREKERLSGVSRTNYVYPSHVTRYPVVKNTRTKMHHAYTCKKGFSCLFEKKMKILLYIYFSSYCVGSAVAQW